MNRNIPIGIGIKTINANVRFDLEMALFGIQSTIVIAFVSTNWSLIPYTMAFDSTIIHFFENKFEYRKMKHWLSHCVKWIRLSWLITHLGNDARRSALNFVKRSVIEPNCFNVISLSSSGSGWIGFLCKIYYEYICHSLLNECVFAKSN